MALHIWDNHRKLWLLPLDISFSEKGVVTRIDAIKPGDERLKDGWFTYEGKDLELVSILGDLDYNSHLLPLRLPNGYLRRPGVKLRCELNSDGKTMVQPKNRERKGYVLGYTRDNVGYKVLWDGCKATTTYHKDFINIIDETDTKAIS